MQMRSRRPSSTHHRRPPPGRPGSRGRPGTAGAAGAGPRHPPPSSARSFTLFGIREERPGPRWQALFAATWPAYRAWYLQDGDDARPDLATARAQLARHMPELVSTWEAMVALTGDDDVAARMLTMWDAPAFAPGCSQAAQVGDDPIMVRNYDYSPDLFEWVVYSSEFTGRKVIGTSDCLWGLLDGMNDDGLVISLTHGGRQSSAPGFAIPLVVRYLLEVAGTVDEARAALDRTPDRRVVQPHHDGRHRCGGHRIRVTGQRAGVRRLRRRDQPPRASAGASRACTCPPERGASRPPPGAAGRAEGA